MLMTATQAKNKLQAHCFRAGIENESQLRTALREYGIGSATSQRIWEYGVTKERKYELLLALESILQVSYDKFLEDVK